jgi:hypothetical protein
MLQATDAAADVGSSESIQLMGSRRMVMGSAQRNALNKTALGTANALASWSNLLTAEMQKQGVERHSKRTPTGENSWFGPKYTTDDHETVTFERLKIRRLLDEMAKVRDELLRFEKLKSK